MLISSLTTFLKYFADIARYRSFSQAAKKNFISQSAISQAIKKLENACGFALFVHDRNHFQLTSQGKVLLEKIQSLLQQVESLEQCFSDIREEKQVKLQFGCMHSIALAVFPQVFPLFNEEFPSAEINFHLGHGGLIFDRVRKGEVDFGIVLDNEDLSDFHAVPIYAGTFEAFCAPGTSSETFLFSEPTYESTIFKRHYKETFGVYPDVQMKVASWEVIASLVEAGVGIGYFPDYLQMRHPTLEKKPFPFPSLEYEMVAIFRSATFISKPAKRFLELFQTILQPVECSPL